MCFKDFVALFTEEMYYAKLVAVTARHAQLVNVKRKKISTPERLEALALPSS